MKIFKKLLIVYAVLITASGCRKLDIAPTDRFSELTFWTVNENVYNALHNNYSLMYNSGLYFDAEALSDNAYSPTGDLNVIASGNANSQTAKFTSDWGTYYSAIKSCNIFLTNVDKNTTLPAATLSRLKAETRFLRAFAHFNLTKWYGNVPIMDKDGTPEDAKTVSPSPRASVVQFVVDELQAALGGLPSKNQLPSGENGRITRGAALALQARVLLYEGNRMAEVVRVCEQLIDEQDANGTYSLESSYSGLFNDPQTNKNSNEVILSLQYVASLRTWQNFWDFAPRSAGGRVSNMAPTQELVNDYIMLNGKAIGEAGSGFVESNPYVNRDPRLTATVVYHGYNWTSPTINKTIYIQPGTDPIRPALDEYSAGSQSSSATGYYWRKYFDPSALANFVSGNNLHLFRYAEILLTYAEAKHSLGQMDATVWNKTIRALRARAGFQESSALDYPGNADMTNIIRRERRVELAMEGLRVDDIRRWKIAETVMNGYIHGAKYAADQSIDNGYIRVQSRKFDTRRDYLWAIPPRDISLNNNLIQNPEYTK